MNTTDIIETMTELRQAITELEDTVRHQLVRNVTDNLDDSTQLITDGGVDQSGDTPDDWDLINELLGAVRNDERPELTPEREVALGIDDKHYHGYEHCIEGQRDADPVIHRLIRLPSGHWIQTNTYPENSTSSMTVIEGVGELDTDPVELDRDMLREDLAHVDAIENTDEVVEQLADQYDATADVLADHLLDVNAVCDKSTVYIEPTDGVTKGWDMPEFDVDGAYDTIHDAVRKAIPEKRPHHLDTALNTEYAVEYELDSDAVTVDDLLER